MKHEKAAEGIEIEIMLFREGRQVQNIKYAQLSNEIDERFITQTVFIW